MLSGLVTSRLACDHTEAIMYIPGINFSEVSLETSI